MSITEVRINLRSGGEWRIKVRPEALAKVDGLPSGKPVRLERRVSDVQSQQILVKPYYRRTIGDTLVIFAVEATPEGDQHE